MNWAAVFSFVGSQVPLEVGGETFYIDLLFYHLRLHCYFVILLCETRNTAVVEYALQNIAQPIGVSTYRVARELPTAIRKELPSVEDLQEVVNKLRGEIETLQQEHPDEL